eukprot:1744903-Rhodomonas_salina.2
MSVAKRHREGVVCYLGTPVHVLCLVLRLRQQHARGQHRAMQQSTRERKKIAFLQSSDDFLQSESLARSCTCDTAAANAVTGTRTGRETGT